MWADLVVVKGCRRGPKDLRGLWTSNFFLGGCILSWLRDYLRIVWWGYVTVDV